MCKIPDGWWHGTIPDAVALNIKDRETERLAAEVAALAGESKTQAVKIALQERRARLAVQGGARNRHANFVRFLETEAWPRLNFGDCRTHAVARRAL